MKFNKGTLQAAGAVFFVFGFSAVAFAATAVTIGSTNSFAILGASTITNTGSTVINGDVGLSPGTSITGFPPGTVHGTQHVADAIALQAQNDLTTAYNNAAGQTPVTRIATELGGVTLTPGVYDSASGTFQITGTLTLDGQGNPGAVFIFKTATTLITANASSINLINSAQACNIFWQVGSSATLGTNSTFKGNILALISATLTGGANVEGSVLSRGGAVTLDTNTISRATCAPPPPAPVVVPAPVPVIAPITAPSVAPVITPAPVGASPSTPTITPTLPATGAGGDALATLAVLLLSLSLALAGIAYLRRVSAKL